MSVDKSDSRLIFITGEQAMIAGIQKHMAGLTSFSVGSQTMTVADIVKVFQDRLTTAQAAQAAHAQVSAAVKADRDKRAQTKSFATSFERIVRGMFAESPDTLADFGLKPFKQGTRTVEAVADAIAKSKATRAARHTMGSKQKEKIKGTVPPTAPPASPPEAPASGPTGTASGTAPPAAPAGGTTSHA